MIKFITDIGYHFGAERKIIFCVKWFLSYIPPHFTACCFLTSCTQQATRGKAVHLALAGHRPDSVIQITRHGCGLIHVHHNVFTSNLKTITIVSRSQSKWSQYSQNRASIIIEPTPTLLPPRSRTHHNTADQHTHTIHLIHSLFTPHPHTEEIVSM